MIFCHDKREYMTLGEYMEKYPIAYAEAVESMTAEQKALFAARFEDRYIYLPKDETSDTGENFSITANVTNVTPDADNPESLSAGGTAYWKYTIYSDAEDPVIAVTGCEWIAPSDGMIFLFNPTGDITITVTASLKYYNVTLNGENCSFSPSSVRIQARGSVRVNVIPATNYKWNGTLTVTGAAAIKNVSGNYFDLMGATGDVTVSVTCDRIVYPLTVSGINCTPNPKPTQIAAGGTLAITYTAAEGYDLPEASGVGVTGCSFGWNQSTGVLTLYNPTGTVAAGVVAVAKSYAITATVTNGTATGANVIHAGETVALTIAANTGYNLPDTVTVTGASQTWNKETGTLTLSNPTGAVTVSAVCVETTKTLEAGTYKWVDSPANISYEKSTDLTFTSNSESYSRLNLGIYIGGSYINYTANADLVTGYFANHGWGKHTLDAGEYKSTVPNTAYQTITLSTSQTVSADFYNWAITGGNLVKQTGETWVLNDEPHFSPLTSTFNLSLSFSSNDINYDELTFSSELVPMHNDAVSIKYGVNMHDTNVYYSGSWINQAYRTITFAQPVTDTTLLAWLQANGIKQ